MWLKREDKLNITLTCKKMKDGPEFEDMHFHLPVVALPDESTSCVIVEGKGESPKPDTPTEPEKPPKPKNPFTTNQWVILEYLNHENCIKNGTNATQIMSATAVGESTTHNVLGALKSKGLVTQKKAREPYFVTDAGIAKYAEFAESLSDDTNSNNSNSTSKTA